MRAWPVGHPPSVRVMGEQSRSGRGRVDRTVDAAPPEQRAVRRVDDRIDGHPGDVAFDELDPLDAVVHHADTPSRTRDGKQSSRCYRKAAVGWMRIACRSPFLHVAEHHLLNGRALPARFTSAAGTKASAAEAHHVIDLVDAQAQARRVARRRSRKAGRSETCPKIWSRASVNKRAQSDAGSSPARARDARARRLCGPSSPLSAAHPPARGFGGGACRTAP